MATPDIETLKNIEAMEDTELHALCQSWIECLERYSSLHARYEIDDNGWWHNERASISLLAGAAWKLGWVALEEFGTNKRGHKIPSEERGERVGRCDLYLSSEKTSFAIEAKQAWQRIGERSAPFADAENQMQKAWQDSGYLHSHEADRRLAVTFIVPHLPISQVKNSDAGQVDAHKLRNHVNEWLEQVGDFQRLRGKATRYAYYFPTDGHRYTNEYTGRIFPGVVMVAEERLRGG
ncbi:hypothetical protein [Kushneria phyllosphaerae]|uniref:Uncharacterized protein n=1 Tax=Kushneria phyllosphaerae TaxID=2100822 RepID=A0A2R8CKJ5_9GAMM|nr:hypothetical protein [Kushneria phyllosphaerae]SPJ33409.1 hypothetical protein KSP9073_01418 [Kushneria phyllosphaerae]